LSLLPKRAEAKEFEPSETVSKITVKPSPGFAARTAEIKHGAGEKNRSNITNYDFEKHLAF
jgi:hypothetical protein